MARIETTLDYIKKAIDDNTEQHKTIIDNLNKELNKKADIRDLDEFKLTVWKIVIIMGSALTIFISILNILM